MGAETKNILMLARNKKAEALRMAVGLTLLDDSVQVAVLGKLNNEDPEIEVQLESLDFADVPVVTIETNQDTELAKMIINSDVVYVV
jgi:hypothetical protein